MVAFPQRKGPSGPKNAATGGGIIQTGFAQCQENDLELAAEAVALVPTDTEDPPTPVRVVLPDVTPGNYLEVEYRAVVRNDDAEDPAEIEFIVVVSFDGSTSFPTNFFAVVNSACGNDTVPPGSNALFSQIALVEIPEGATTATVSCLYATGAQPLLVGGVELPTSPAGTSFSLKATEIAATVVSQAGNSYLTPVA